MTKPDDSGAESSPGKTLASTRPRLAGSGRTIRIDP